MTFSPYIISGLALFAMFFGAGNLIYPLQLGIKALDTSTYAVIGIFLTGVLTPFAGVYGAILHNGSLYDYHKTIGKIPTLVLLTVIIALIGPFGAMPRCILVSYGGIQLLLPDLPLVVFSTIYSIITYLLLIKESSIVDITGKFLTPIMILSMTIIVVVALTTDHDHNLMNDYTPMYAFKSGLMEGYNTMDLLAGSFFGVTTVAYFRSKYKNDKEVILNSKKACLIGMILQALVYFSLVFIGYKYADNLISVRPEQSIVESARILLGEKFAGPILAMLITLSCVTTSTAVAIIFVNFIHDKLGKYGLTKHLSIILTVLLCFALSLLGFGIIASFLAKIMTIMYPALIVLAFGNILSKSTKIDITKPAFWCTVAISIAMSTYEYLISI